MHQDLQTLRSQIIPSELDCQQAELDGTIKLTTPEYGSIEALDLKLQLNGGRGSAMFQPIGFSRPDSWCRGTAFYPPKNHDQSIEYLDFSSHFERKKMWATDKIRRAVVTYHLDCKQFISDTSSTLQWIIINNLLHKINHHSKNHTSSLDPKICDGKKKTPSRCCSCGSASTSPRIPDYRGITALHHSLSTALTVSCCPNFRA